MTFEEVLPALKAGKKIKRDGFVYFEPNGEFVRFIMAEYPEKIQLDYNLAVEDILADDWEIIDE